jgi:mRNA-degrading endonuclease RelE of RelBE toxin-antitoxin system
LKPYRVRFTKEAIKDFNKLTPRLKQKLQDILENTIAPDPRSGKHLVGELAGFYSYSLSYKDRIVYSVDDVSRTVFIHRTKTHYGD